jgi:hypothetical protein
MAKPEPTIRLDLNNPVFQEQLLMLLKAERHAALDTLNKIRQLTWNQLYREPGLKGIICGCSRSRQITTPPTAKSDLWLDAGAADVTSLIGPGSPSLPPSWLSGGCGRARLS